MLPAANPLTTKAEKFYSSIVIVDSHLFARGIENALQPIVHHDQDGGVGHIHKQCGKVGCV